MNRVVITGMGSINAIAPNFPMLLSALRKCKHNIKHFPTFATTQSCPVAKVEIDNNESKLRTFHLADIACREALANNSISRKASLVFSSSTIGMPELEENFLQLKQDQSPEFDYTNALSVGEFARKLAAKYNINGNVSSFSTACSSSANAIGYAFLQVQHGITDMALAGGADALCRLTYYGFQSLKVMSPIPCTPFDIKRQGMNLGEGAGFIVLESLQSAKERQAKIYGEILGVGMSADSHHMSAPDPEGYGAFLAMSRALDHAKIAKEKIAYISAHGTGTAMNDRTESIAIHKVFQEHTMNIYVNSLKSYFGHTLGAAGALAIICTLCSINHSYIPPTLGLENCDPLCNIRVVPSSGVEVEVPYAVVNAFAFGGNNTSLVIGKYVDA